MRIMGLDLGNKTLGVAISDPTGLISTGYPTIRFKSRDFDTALTEVMKIIKDKGVEKIVLGLPKNMDGTEGYQAETSRNFKKMLEEVSNLEVVLYDERLTSRMALNQMIMGGENRSNRHDKIDEMAAKIILQDYLDKIRSEKK
ncbi:MAG: Holliday junction resolvase RuvX [Gammaproteobacteria bacterium]|nr:Holliday junction resolvase RuvX [Gammaproteobacteria bacterium]